MMLETSVDLRGSQAWSQFDDAMTQFGGPGGPEAQNHAAAAHDEDVGQHPPAADSDEEASDTGPFGRPHCHKTEKTSQACTVWRRGYSCLFSHVVCSAQASPGGVSLAADCPMIAA